jgi:tetratricopeptide (TPR) repeat protein
MRLMGVFLLACGVLIALLLWQVTTALQSITPPLRATTTQPTTAPASAATQPALPKTAPATEPPRVTAPEQRSAGEQPPAEPPASADRTTERAAATTQPGESPVQYVPPIPESVRQRVRLAEQTLVDNPYHEPALRDLLGLQLEYHQWSAATETLGRLLELQPDDPELLTRRGNLLLTLGRPVEAVGPLRHAVELRPDDVAAWHNLAVAHQSAGHLADARAAWNEVLERAPTPAVRRQRAIVLLELARYDAAAEDLRTLWTSPDAIADDGLNLALAEWRLARPAAAIAVLEELLAQHPTHVVGMNRLSAYAWERCRLGAADAADRCEQTIRWCQASLAQFPEQPEIRARLSRALAARLERTGRGDQ